MFNSLKYAKKLEEAGVTREQAEMHMQILSDIVEGNLATKQDIKDILRGFEKMDDKLIQLEQRLTIKVGTIVTVVVAAVATIYQLLTTLAHR